MAFATMNSISSILTLHFTFLLFILILAMVSFNKKTRGRQKLEIEKIENEESLQVAFSKRRNGLFKKACELCTLCGAKVVIVVFSPTGKPFSFGHPYVNVVADKFLNTNNNGNDNSSNNKKPSMNEVLLELDQDANIFKLNKEYTELQNQLEVEKKKGEAFKLKRANQNQVIFKNIEDLSFDELEELKKSIGAVQNKLMFKRVEDELLNDTSIDMIDQSFVVHQSAILTTSVHVSI